YMVYLSFVNLHCDVFHTIPGGVGLSGEAHLFTYSKNLEFKKVKGFARLELPKYYKPLYINDVFIFHLATVKNSSIFSITGIGETGGDWAITLDFPP
ncbi:MAG: hypothetical protein QXG12_01880, partial [Thermoproteota archaeon]